MSSIPLRPDAGGSKGRSITVKTNFFPVTALADVPVYHYDVCITPELPPANSRRVWAQVELLLPKDTFLAFDGMKNAFGPKDIPDQTYAVHILKHEVSVLPQVERVAPQRGGRGGARGGRGASSADRAKPPTMVWAPAAKCGPQTKLCDSEKFSVVVRKVNTVSFHELLLFAQGKGKETDNVLHCSNVLSIVLRHVPSMLFTPVGQNFFTPEGRIPMMGGLEIWRGYHQSVKALMAGHLGINIDLASCVFRKGGISALDYLCEVFGVRDNEQLLKMPRINQRINEELKGVSVITNHRADARHRFKVARISTDTANSYKFTPEEGKGEINITQYFKTNYKINLKYPNLPIVWKANGKTGFPIECLDIVPSQRYSKRLSGDQTSDMIRSTTQKPVDRQKSIQEAVDVTLKYANNPYMNAFGFKVSTEMMNVKARVLPAPSVVFKGNKSAPGTDGSWNITKFKLVDTPQLSSFGFVFFVRLSNTEAAAIRDKIVKKWVEQGMNISTNNVPFLVCNPSNATAVKTALINCFKECQTKLMKRCQMLVCIIDKTIPGLYTQIKRITLTEAGVISQCMLYKHVQFPEEIKDTYISNVALKANIKLGGASNYVSALGSLPATELTLFMGADVTHSHPGSNSPSIAAVVASVDGKAVKYHTYIRAQGHREEIISQMESIMTEVLINFEKANNGKSPKRVMFFRDGVASGQFDKVKDVEVRGLKAAMHLRKLDNVPLTFLVVQKRHHIRLFPVDQNMDRSGNCMPGTVIDTAIVHPTEFNFLLQSHAGIQGMSRGCLYHVLHDEAKFTSDALQSICYSLCFLAERATRTISMVAPAYRAHIAAFYARMFLDEETGSVSSKGGAMATLKNVVPAMEKQMYYM